MSERDTPPRCKRCGASHPRVVSRYVRIADRRGLAYEWCCADCEYLTTHPDATRGCAVPCAMRPVKLQRETLF